MGPTEILDLIKSGGLFAFAVAVYLELRLIRPALDSLRVVFTAWLTREDPQLVDKLSKLTPKPAALKLPGDGSS